MAGFFVLEATRAWLSPLGVAGLVILRSIVARLENQIYPKSANRGPTRRNSPLGSLALGFLTALLGSISIAACGSSATGRITVSRAPRIARWTEFVRVRRPLDLAGPRQDGALVLAADARLSVLTEAGGVVPFATGSASYRSPGGEEPYVALSPGGAFGNGIVYALRLTAGRGVVAISARGRIRRLASLRVAGLIDGITFDQTGRFAHRLLVTVNAGARTAVEALDAGGRVSTITSNAPRLEGGISVAPPTFGRFAGDLIAPSETSGQVFAITPQGKSELLANSQLPHGNDIGVESEGFVPGDPRADAFMADRRTPGNPHPGDDAVLRIRSQALRAAGVRRGDLVVSTEGGALTDDIRPSAAGYLVRLVALGPAIAHGEGHIIFARSG
jgi:hypothetical protein